MLFPGTFSPFTLAVLNLLKVISVSSHPIWPIATQGIQISKCVTKKKSIIPGPGHKLPSPHPSPNSPAPINSLKSTLLFCGIHNFSAKTGTFCFLMISWNVKMLTPTAPPITSIRDGSQSS